MAAYFDSSVLLAILSRDRHADLAADLWDRFEERVSSILLQAECLTVTQKLARQTPRYVIPKGTLDHYLSTMEIKDVDQSIIQILQQKPELSFCRSLDALHLATALFFRENCDDPFYLATFDKRMSEAAKRVGFEVLDG